MDQNGIITTYEVQYEPLETFGGLIQTQTMNVSVPNRSVTLRNLQEFVNYTISVRACTSVGEGPYSIGVVERTLEDGKLHPLFSLCLLSILSQLLLVLLVMSW